MTVPAQLLNLGYGVIALAIVFGAIWAGSKLGNIGKRGGAGPVIAILLVVFILAGAHSDAWLPVARQALIAFHLAR